MTRDKQGRKEIANAYKQSFRRMGIYQIRNQQNGKILVCSSMNLDSAKNRFEFMKSTNLNSILELQHDWKDSGGACFIYEELDQIKPKEEVLADQSELKGYQQELDELLELWIEKLQPFGERGYNKQK